MRGDEGLDGPRQPQEQPSEEGHGEELRALSNEQRAAGKGFPREASESELGP